MKLDFAESDFFQTFKRAFSSGTDGSNTNLFFLSFFFQIYGQFRGMRERETEKERETNLASNQKR